MGNTNKICADCGKLTGKPERKKCKGCAGSNWGPTGTEEELTEWWDKQLELRAKAAEEQVLREKAAIKIQARQRAKSVSDHKKKGDLDEWLASQPERDAEAAAEAARKQREREAEAQRLREEAERAHAALEEAKRMAAERRRQEAEAEMRRLEAEAADAAAKEAARKRAEAARKQAEAAAKKAAEEAAAEQARLEAEKKAAAEAARKRRHEQLLAAQAEQARLKAAAEAAAKLEREENERLAREQALAAQKREEARRLREAARAAAAADKAAAEAAAAEARRLAREEAKRLAKEEEEAEARRKAAQEMEFQFQAAEMETHSKDTVEQASAAAIKAVQDNEAPDIPGSTVFDKVCAVVQKKVVDMDGESKDAEDAAAQIMKDLGYGVREVSECAGLAAGLTENELLKKKGVDEAEHEALVKTTPIEEVLMARFPDASYGDVKMALKFSRGHGGKAATFLARRFKRASVECETRKLSLDQRLRECSKVASQAVKRQNGSDQSAAKIAAEVKTRISAAESDKDIQVIAAEAADVAAKSMADPKDKPIVASAAAGAAVKRVAKARAMSPEDTKVEVDKAVSKAFLKYGGTLQQAKKQSTLDEVDDLVEAAIGDSCPDVDVDLVRRQLRVKKRINFVKNKTIMLGDADAILEQVAKVMTTMEKICDDNEIEPIHLCVEGHTNSKKKNAHTALHIKLSKFRAKTVQTWLISKGGVNAELLEIYGWGASKPLIEGGHEANQRVEFKVIDPDEFVPQD